jgi:hypothetical protein
MHVQASQCMRDEGHARGGDAWALPIGLASSSGKKYFFYLLRKNKKKIAKHQNPLPLPLLSFFSLLLFLLTLFFINSHRLRGSVRTTENLSVVLFCLSVIKKRLESLRVVQPRVVYIFCRFSFLSHDDALRQ